MRGRLGGTVNEKVVGWVGRGGGEVQSSILKNFLE